MERMIELDQQEQIQARSRAEVFVEELRKTRPSSDTHRDAGSMLHRVDWDFSLGKVNEKVTGWVLMMSGSNTAIKGTLQYLKGWWDSKLYHTTGSIES